MKKISAIILADNNKDVIEQCLKTISWVSEKILIDLGSTDGTLNIAKKYNCRIVKGAKQYDFSLWRNQGAKISSSEWLLYVDTDERITNSLRQEIQTVINKKPDKLINNAFDIIKFFCFCSIRWVRWSN